MNYMHVNYGTASFTMSLVVFDNLKKWQYGMFQIVAYKVNLYATDFQFTDMFSAMEIQ